MTKDLLARELIGRFVRGLKSSVRPPVKRSIQDVLLICGPGRSGTTWVARTIAKWTHNQLSFEPFNPRYVRKARDVESRRHLPPHSQDHERLTAQVKALLTGKARSGWTEIGNPVWISRGLIVKAIRINPLLPWICANFPELRVLLLVRNPIAVAYSRVCDGWKPALDELVGQQSVLDLLPPGVIDCVTAVSNDFDAHLVSVCIENYIPLAFGLDRSVAVVRFEDLISDASRGYLEALARLGYPDSDSTSANDAELERKFEAFLHKSGLEPQRSKSQTSDLPSDTGLRDRAQLLFKSSYMDRLYELPL